MAVITHFSDLDLTKEYTFSDYLQWQFTERVELLKGFIKQMSPAPSRKHQTVSRNLSGIFYNFLYKKPCNFFSAPFDVRLPFASAKKDTTVVQPDLCIICDESKLDDYGCNGAPDLIVEIVSPNNSKYDVDTKFKLYQEAGVMEYWIVQTEMKTVLVYRLQNGIYVGSKPFAEGEIIESPLFPEMTIAVDEVFYRV
ncbi:restriction endonuclease [Flavobacterium branchiophilum]|uniref:Uma2 family endonuclease n=1 Tax=Flavobacterium branchiophilum TaxID=55197 RepID=A0A543G325_9FLAO|nr:Uma2 family endonuclease [Flavobacterium branchiophilum]OXA75001.1 restriction endonuclease [Flavobacterium branchiophilum] [Flavobacterium branchiophilum NBRC 15030 = ATCC 35035]TQM40478.1 Uma2 family endonuclease [Flavobacterium branchiophilum]